MTKTVPVLCVLFAALVPVAAPADTSSDEATIRAMVADVWKKVAARKYEGTDISPRGAWQATSQGGLWERVDRTRQETLLNKSPNTLEFTARHVEVTLLGSGKDVAHVNFYLTGTIRLPDGNVIPNYRTRASWVLEKTDGNWMVVGAHYSPLFGGSGVRFE